MIRPRRCFRNLSPFDIVISTDADSAVLVPAGSAIVRSGLDVLRLTTPQPSLRSPGLVETLTVALASKVFARWTRLDVVVGDTHPGGASIRQTSEDTLRPCAAWTGIKIFQKGQDLLALSTPRLDGWMAHLPDTMSLGDVSLPGTHQSTALYGVPVSQCQQPSTPLSVQLVDGIRFLDVRLAEKNGKLIAYHGILTQRVNFENLLADVKAFLQNPDSNRETVIMSIDQENASTELFLTLLKGYIQASDPSLWFLANRIPSLSEVRGKIVLFSRFGGDDVSWKLIGGRGIHPVGWQDSVREGFRIKLPSRPKDEKRDDSEDDNWGRTLGISDWYNIGTVLSIPEKADAVQRTLLEEAPLDGHVPLVFCSASSFPLAFPVTVARGFGWPRWGLGVRGVNDRMADWLIERLAAAAGAPNGATSDRSHVVRWEAREKGDQAGEKARSARVEKGWILFDFYRSPDILVDAVVALNFC